MTNACGRPTKAAKAEWHGAEWPATTGCAGFEMRDPDDGQITASNLPVNPGLEIQGNFAHGSAARR